MTEEVNHPAHYCGEDNPYEVIKVLREWDLNLARGFCWGNVIKYTQRAGKKGSTIADRKKAKWYADELVSIEAELATRPKKAVPSEIPVILPEPGRYRMYIDWENRTHKLVREDTQFVGGIGGSSSVGGGGAGGSSASVAGNSRSSAGAAAGGAAGGSYEDLPGGLTIHPPLKRCASLFNCVGGYHGPGCPLHKEP